jgi:glucans biosynthesis protein
LGSKVSLPLSGFRLRSQINTKKIWDEFLVFQGASYFRAVAQHLLYGLSARGLAINTAEPSGEEFPAFTHFWVERPAPHANSIVIYALLESESATGAYRFTVQPGTRPPDVDMTVFPRTTCASSASRRSPPCFCSTRPTAAVSMTIAPRCTIPTACMIESNSGEQIFRQLANPTKLQVSTFTTQPPKGFGLVQRSRDQSDFQDFDAQYERRPSAWIEPKGEWGPGGVELVEIPSGRESNDNIVAFWRPSQGSGRGIRRISPTASPGWPSPRCPKGMGEVMATRSGASLDGKRRVFILDFVGAGEKDRRPAPRSGRLHRQNLQRHADVERRHARMRASFEIDPNDAELIELRMRIMRGDKPVTETWLYRWTHMSSVVNSADAPWTTAGSAQGVGRGGMPPESPLDMPPQDLRYKPSRRTRARRPRRSVRALHPGRRHARHLDLRRLSNAAGRALRQHDLTARLDDFLLRGIARLDRVRGGIGARRRLQAARPPARARARRPRSRRWSCPSTTKIRRAPRRRCRPWRKRSAPSARTRGFEIVILSDSTNADAWIRETAAFDRLRIALKGIMPVWYRRRWQNIARKSGNIEDFVTRWGGRYDHMIVLDADSLIDAPTLQAPGAT